MYGKMRRIKLFESFGEITEQEIRGALVELQDVGYDVLVTKTYNGYSVDISVLPFCAAIRLLVLLVVRFPVYSCSF